MARIAIGAEEKKKLYFLAGLMAAIIVVVVVLYLPKGSSTTTDDDGATKQPTPAAGAKNPSVPPAAGAAGGDANAGGGTGGSGAGGAISAASLVSVSEFRSDPFAPVPKPTPVPTPPPPVAPPAPPGPVYIEPPSIAISAPGSSGIGGSSLPPFEVRTSGSSPILADLPPLVIPRVAIAPTAPAIVTPPGGSSAGGFSRSPNKRLSGVIIGDSVRAILEISNGDTTVTRIVQPGDEVDGIRILRIQRTTEGGRPVTRMYIRENGAESYVDLRPAPQSTGGAGGAAPAAPPRGGRLPF